MEERLKQQLDFILEIDKEKNILRQTHLSGHGRRENDAEHAWHMAIMAYLLKDYANEPVDIAKVMIMCLIHDIVEIDAGDTYAYDTERLKTQKAREDAAKERIFSLLPEDQKKELEELLTQLGPFLSLDFDISRFLQFRYMTCRFGRISREYYNKFETYVYGSEETLFYPCQKNDRYIWGFYFCPTKVTDRIDAVYASMHFEQLDVPEKLYGIPSQVSGCAFLWMIQKSVIFVKGFSYFFVKHPLACTEEMFYN